MQKSSAMMLPKFSEVITLEQDKFSSIEDMCDCVCQYEGSGSSRSKRKKRKFYGKGLKFAWLIDEDFHLCEFIDTLGKSDYDNLNLYNFYVANNIQFPPYTVSLINQGRTELENIMDMSELISGILCDTDKKHLRIVCLTQYRDSRKEYIENLRVKILQQFVYLRISIPVVISEANDNRRNLKQRLSIFGTKKAGKSTLINALLCDEYSPSSSEVPTPCIITYAEDKTSNRDIFIESEGIIKFLSKPEDAKNFLSQKFSEPAKNSAALNEINVTLPVFPEVLRSFIIIDTPGPNFAGSKVHHDITHSEIERSDISLFVMNYSSYLTDDEIKLFDAVYSHRKCTIIIALNKIDEMYASEVVKSYERAADYVKSKLNALGYYDFIIVPVAALTSMESQKINIIIEQEQRQKKLSFVQQIDHLKQKYKGTDKITMLSSVKTILQTMKDFHELEIQTPMSLEETGRIKYLQNIIANLSVTNIN